MGWGPDGHLPRLARTKVNKTKPYISHGQAGKIICNTGNNNIKNLNIVRWGGSPVREPGSVAGGKSGGLDPK